MTKVKIGIIGRPKNDPLVIVCQDHKEVNIDYEETHSSGITITLDNIPRFVDALMFLHANERNAP